MPPCCPALTCPRMVRRSRSFSAAPTPIQHTSSSVPRKNPRRLVSGGDSTSAGLPCHSGSYFLGRPAGFNSDVGMASEDRPQRSRILPELPPLMRWLPPGAAAAGPLSFLVVNAISAFSGQPPLSVPTSLVLPSLAAL